MSADAIGPLASGLLAMDSSGERTIAHQVRQTFALIKYVYPSSVHPGLWPASVSLILAIYELIMCLFVLYGSNFSQLYELDGNQVSLALRWLTLAVAAHGQYK